MKNMGEDLIKLTIDGVPVAVPKGTLVIEAARQMGVMIPHFCYHPKLKWDANCRMCLVEIEKMPKLQTSCSTPVAEGNPGQPSAGLPGLRPGRPLRPAGFFA
jgi:formate dehydrogenase alpha subunit